MAKTDVRAELLEATGLTQKKGETEEAFGGRISSYINEKMTEDAYNELSAASKAWYEKACEVEGGELALPGGGGDGAAAKKSGGAAAKKTAAKKAPAKKAAAKTPAGKKAAAKKTKAKDGDEEGSGPRQSASRAVIEMVCKKPAITNEEIEEKLAAAGMSLGPLAQTASRARMTVEIMQGLGYHK